MPLSDALRGFLWRVRLRYWALMRRIARVVLGAGDVDTDGLIPLERLGVAGRGRIQYQPSGYSWLWRGLRRLPITPADVFLDYGCGKGRVIVQAGLRYPFGKLIGVDISADLVAVARANVERVRPRLRASEVELLVADAATWPLPDEVTYVYMYRPFTGELFETVMQRIVESLDRRPRRLTLVYAYPERDDVVLATGRFRRIRSSRGVDRQPHHSVNVYVSGAA